MHFMLQWFPQFALAILMPLVLPNNADPLMKLVLFIECIPPSANLNLPSQMAWNESRRIFSTSIRLYVLMLFTMMVYLSAAIYLAYGVYERCVDFQLRLQEKKRYLL